MTLADALKRFDHLNAAGLVPDRRRNDATHTISDDRRNVVVSHTRAAVAHAMGLPRDNHADLDDVDLRPLLETLPEIAYRAAEEAGRTAPRNERANVALLLVTVYGHTYDTPDTTGRRPPVSREDVLPAWLPAYDALVADAADAEAVKNSHCRPGLLIQLQNLLIPRGIRGPEEMEDCFEWFMGVVEEEGIERRWTAREMLASLRRAREILDDDRIPTLYQQARPGARGVSSLPDLAERLVKRGCTTDPRTMTDLKIIEVLAPRIYLGLAKRLQQAAVEDLSQEEAYIRMASGIVASLARLGIDTAEKSLVDLYTEIEEVEVGASGEGDPVLTDVMGADYVHTETRSLMRRVIDEGGHHSCELSQIQVVGQQDRSQDTPPFYTDKIIADAKTCFTVVSKVYGDALAKHEKDRWFAVKTEHQSLLRHMARHNENRTLVNHQNKEKVLITWPQAVCMFLPWLADRIERKKADLQRWAKTGREGSRTHQQHLRELDYALREWTLAALLLDDGLRVKNYSGAVANKHLVPIVERDADGRWIGFSAVETKWRGVQDDPEVRLKIKTDSAGRERRRTRWLTPGIVRLDYLFEYWTESRPRELVRRGVLESVDDYDPDDDSWAVLISPTGSRRKSAKHSRSQHQKRHLPLGKHYLSECFGKLHHQFLREELGRDEIPAAWRPKGEWKGLFTAHITRTLIATYIGGICHEWNKAAFLTDDTERTLKRHYSHIRDQIYDLLHVDGPENPQWFDAVIDRMAKKLPGDDWARFWEAFDAANPTAALDRLVDGEGQD